MKKLFIMLISIMLCIVFAGCALIQNSKEVNREPTEAANDAVQATISAEDPIEGSASAGNSTEEAEIADNTSGGGTISKAYESYSGVKADFLTQLTEALTQNEDTVWDAMALLPLVSVELDLIPVTLFDTGKDSLAAGMGFMGATDIEYSENGNQYSVNYSNSEGNPCLFSATYEAGADTLVCSNTKDGAENIYAQYQKTDFGYVAQYYLTNEEGEGRLYQLSLSGKDGIVGVSDGVSKPVALTGSESADFPKTGGAAWYAITGKTVTAFTAEGMDLTFDVPVE